MDLGTRSKTNYGRGIKGGRNAVHQWRLPHRERSEEGIHAYAERTEAARDYIMKCKEGGGGGGCPTSLRKAFNWGEGRPEGRDSTSAMR